MFLESASPNKLLKRRAATHAPRIRPACRDFPDSSRVLPEAPELRAVRAAFGQRLGKGAEGLKSRWRGSAESSQTARKRTVAFFEDDRHASSVPSPVKRG